MDTELLRIINNRRTLHTKLLRKLNRSPEDTLAINALTKQYNDAAKLATNTAAEKKRLWWKQQQIELSEMRTTTPAGYWNVIKRFSSSSRSGSFIGPVVDPTGELVFDGSSHMNAVTDYFSKLYSDEGQILSPNALTTEDIFYECPKDEVGPKILEDPFTNEEVANAIAAAPSGRAPGPDGLRIEVIKGSCRRAAHHSVQPHSQQRMYARVMADWQNHSAVQEGRPRRPSKLPWHYVAAVLVEDVFLAY